MKQRSTCFFFLFGHLSYLFHILHWIILLYFSSYKKVLHDLKQLSFLVTKAPVHLVWETAQRFYVLQAQMYNVTMSAWVEVGEVSLSKKKIDCRGGIPLWTGRILHFSTRLRKFNNIKKNLSWKWFLLWTKNVNKAIYHVIHSLLCSHLHSGYSKSFSNGTRF